MTTDYHVLRLSLMALFIVIVVLMQMQIVSVLYPYLTTYCVFVVVFCYPFPADHISDSVLLLFPLACWQLTTRLLQGIRSLATEEPLARP
mgnify:CR=1 FL=1